jgi:hypothetical protein
MTYAISTYEDAGMLTVEGDPTGGEMPIMIEWSDDDPAFVTFLFGAWPEEEGVAIASNAVTWKLPAEPLIRGVAEAGAYHQAGFMITRCLNGFIIGLEGYDGMQAQMHLVGERLVNLLARVEPQIANAATQQANVLISELEEWLAQQH